MSENSDGTGVRLAGATSVLVLAPSLEDPDDEACIDLMTAHDPADANVLSVTVSESPDGRLALWRSAVGDELPRRVAVVAAGHDSGVGSAAAEAAPSLTVDTLPADAEPVDVGVAAARRLGDWESTPQTTHVCLHSVTALLEAFDREDVIALVNALNGLCAAVGAVSHHHLDPEAHDEGTIAAFRPLYDAVLEHIPGHGWTTTTADASKDRPSFRSGSGAEGDSTAGISVTAPLPYSFDTVLELIGTPRRRTLLYHLKDRPEGAIALDDLVDRVTERERAIPKREAPPPRDTVKRSLVHTHLPKLESVGIVSVDAEEGVVHYHANPALEACLEYIETLELG